MLAELRSGIVSLADGVINTLRGDKTGALVTANAHGFYTEAAVRGTIMEACTAVAGVAPGTALSTAPPMTLWNPPASGKNLVLLKAAMGYVSGTLGAGVLLMAKIDAQLTAPSGGTELTPVSTLIGAPRGVGRVFQASTLVSTPVILRPLFTMGAFVGTQAQAPMDTVDVIDGSIAIPPGAGVVLQGLAGAGTSPLVLLALIWEEVPV
jgi:hypothetical protein